MQLKRMLFTLIIFVVTLSIANATETENLGISILPSPGKVTVDGKADDWDLSGGVFTCSDVENQRETFGTWLHAMYDSKNLYILVRWLDETPMNNPGSSKGDYGFAGDCLQFRTITAPGTKDEQGAHWTCWRDKDGINVVNIAYGVKFDGPEIKNAISKGAQQVCLATPDGKGYLQELAIPWELLAKNGYVPKAGDNITFTLEPNFTIGINGRWSMKDIFKAGITPDRVFTFMSPQCWGVGALLAQGNITPRTVRLSDRREFKVSMAQGKPVVDWSGLIKIKELKGFKPITFTMPEDGYISLNILDADNTVVRQLLNAAFYSKGEHTILWDGLTTTNWRTPGSPVLAGGYHWKALWHKGIGLKFVGWAHNSGNAPWDSTPTSNWGGDHGMPIACAADGEKVYLGWSGAEAGKALLAVDLNGNVQWKTSRFAMSGADKVTVDNGIVYAQSWGGNLFRVDAKKGGFSSWAGKDDSPDLLVKSLWGDEKGMPEVVDSMAAKTGRLYLAFTKANIIMVLDGQTGKVLKKIDIKAPVDIVIKDSSTAYVLSERTTALAVQLEDGSAKPFITGLTNAAAITIDGAGRLYVGEGNPGNQVKIFSPAGKQVGVIGRKGGRAILGKWTSDGLAFISDMAIDAQGKLWVTEADMTPKRISVWDTKTGKLVNEFFGPTTYGALGGSIDPLDPTIMAGAGAEWKLDPKTGRAVCTTLITRDGMENSRFAVGSNGRLYLAVAGSWAYNIGRLRIYERRGAGDYMLRTEISYYDDKGVEVSSEGDNSSKIKETRLWVDANGDGKQQPNEIASIKDKLIFSGWYMNITPDLTLYSGKSQFKVTGFTKCGAPKYDFAKPVAMPSTGLGSADGRYVMHNGEYGVNETWNECFNIASGKRVWTYPDNFVGVHGSHNAVPPEAGMIRGSYGPCGTAKLPDPIGNVWVIATNVGEWHILTEDGFYLTRLFQPDPLKFKWPEQAVPGVSMDNVPCGMGGEDFGGSIAGTPDGRLFLQAGKTGFWNLEATGLNNVKSISGAAISISEPDIKVAQSFHDGYLQTAVTRKTVKVKKLAPTFTGDLDKDFAGAEIIAYQKQDDAAVRSSLSWDATTLYLAWEVKDNTPWVNGATDPAQMYIGGDTVDFQLATNPIADPARNEAVSGDLRLSIGNYQGKPTAVLYRKVSTEKKPKIFSSGVVRSYPMDYVSLLADAKIVVTPREKTGYLVEAAIPLEHLGINRANGLLLHGDLGVTHGDTAGSRTRLRSYWNNQHTGIVDDAVFELMMEPANWGEVEFTP